MWFLGLLFGALAGSMGGVDGAIVGGVAGGLFVAIAQWSSRGARRRLDEVEQRLAQLTQRIEELESRAERPPARAVPAYEPAGPPPLPPPTPDAPASEEPPAPRTAVADEPITTEAPPRADTSGARLPAGVDAPGGNTEAPPRPDSTGAGWFDWLLGGTTVVRLGVVILFLGVAFLVKYASEHVRVPIETRLAAVALGAMALLAVGWRLRGARLGYALIVQGAGVGILYLTTFAAFRLYGLVPGPLAFALLATIAVLSAALAVLQDSRSLAAAGVSGGFLAPILASTGGGSHVALFGFYALLNASILGIAWFKPWRVLNVLGFAFTFCIGLAWGAQYYRPEWFASTEPFLILFFLFYAAIAILFALRQGATPRNPVDATLVFGTPVAAFGLQSALVRDTQFGAAFSAVALAAFYLVTARWLFARGGLRLLAESFLALGIAFTTLAIPLALDGRWTAAAWAAEGAAILWAGLRQSNRLALIAGALLQFGAGIAFHEHRSGPPGTWPVLNSFFAGCLMIAVAGLFSAWFFGRNRSNAPLFARFAVPALFVWGCGWWFGGGLVEIGKHVPARFEHHAAIVFLAASCAAFSLLHQRAEWAHAGIASLALIPALGIYALGDLSRFNHPFHALGFPAWPLAIAAALWILWRNAESGAAAWLHTVSIWISTLLLGAEVTWWAREWITGDSLDGMDGWRAATRPLAWIAALLWLTTNARRLAWPVQRHPDAYLVRGPAGIAVLLGGWLVAANWSNSGAAAPLPYLPLLNPLDLASAASILAIFTWTRNDAPPRVRMPARAALAAVAFVWLNSALLRAIHHWTGVPFELDDMARSTVVQASVSIFWSVLALAAMVTGARQRSRTVWAAGAALMAVVVVKLFLVDLSNVGGIERIVSFIGVGLLLMVVGYFAPVPPGNQGETQ